SDHDRIDQRENGSGRLRISFRRAARPGHFQQPNQNDRLAVASPRPTDSRNSWDCSRHSTAPIDFPGTRRKRSRPLIAVVYPDLPEAEQSGFLLLLGVPVGGSEITIQVQDYRKIWRNDFRYRCLGFSCHFSGSTRSAARRGFLSTYLAQLFVG